MRRRMDRSLIGCPRSALGGVDAVGEGGGSDDEDGLPRGVPPLALSSWRRSTVVFMGRMAGFLQLPAAQWLQEQRSLPLPPLSSTKGWNFSRLIYFFHVIITGSSSGV